MLNKEKILEKLRINFSFGKNWQKYLRSLTKEKILNARNSLLEHFKKIKGKTFLDIGCGSGLFSYSMYFLGAKEITSFDIDPFSVYCAKFLRSKVNYPKNWKIYLASILDKEFISKLGKYDIVYSWGVLHHTGKMWQAINNAASLVKENGLFFISIYNKTNFSKFWLEIKKFYNKSPNLGKKIMEFTYFSILYFLYPLLTLKNPIKRLNIYIKRRGMDPIIDITDWLGGYPYEYANFEAVKDFLNKIDSNFKMIKFKKTKYGGCNEFLFKKVDKIN